METELIGAKNKSYRAVGEERVAEKEQQHVHHFITFSLNYLKSKRPEENYKLVFKRGLKFIKEEFKAKFRLRFKKRQLEQIFVKHYFGQGIHKASGGSPALDEKTVFEPCQAALEEISLFNPRTINSKYIKYIMRSQMFMNDFVTFLVKHFKEDYVATRENKIRTVLEKCYQLISD